jgi:glycosyltransferase involved in cell wall biosynthesis
MRICLVTQEYPPETGHGGIATQTRLKADGFTRIGHEVTVLSHSVDGTETTLRVAGVSVVRIPGWTAADPPPDEAARWVAYTGAVDDALGRLEAERPFDVVEFPEYGAEGFAYLTARRRSPARRVVHLHGSLSMLAEHLGWPARDSELYRVGTRMEEAAVDNADAVYSSSVTTLEWCRTHMGLTGEVPVLNSGVDVDHYRPGAGPRGPRPSVVFVGKVGPSKGVDVLAAAMCAVADRVPGARLILYGKEVGTALADIRAAATAGGHPDLIDFRGFLDRADAPRALAEAWVFAAPSPWEGGPGFVFLEAMACGLPVVGCRGSGIDETVADGETGLLVEVGDTDGLAHVLERFLTDAALRKRLGAAARRHVEDHADTRRCTREIAAFYESVAAGRR